MKFSDIIKVHKTIPANSKGWQSIEEISEELKVGVDYTRLKVRRLIKDGRVEEARVNGSPRKLYRIIK